MDNQILGHELEEWYPQEPTKGPPLPRWLGVYWPWYKGVAPPTAVAPPTGISPTATAAGATASILIGQGALVLPAPAVSQLAPTNGQATYGVFLPAEYGVDPSTPIVTVTGRTPEAALATAQENAEMYRLSGLTYLSAKEQGIVTDYNQFQSCVKAYTGIPGVEVFAIGDWSGRGTIGVVTEMGQPARPVDAGAFRILVETAPLYKAMFFTDPEALKAPQYGVGYQMLLWAYTELGIIPYVASPELAAATAAAGAAAGAVLTPTEGGEESLAAKQRAIFLEQAGAPTAEQLAAMSEQVVASGGYPIFWGER